jgi:hypothetical protein
MDNTNPSPNDRAEVAAERFDLEPEPTPQPTVADILEGVAAALQAAVASPMQTAARCRDITAYVQVAASGT